MTSEGGSKEHVLNSEKDQPIDLDKAKTTEATTSSQKAPKTRFQKTTDVSKVQTFNILQKEHTIISEVNGVTHGS